MTQIRQASETYQQIFTELYSIFSEFEYGSLEDYLPASDGPDPLIERREAMLNRLSTFRNLLPQLSKLSKSYHINNLRTITENFVCQKADIYEVMCDPDYGLSPWESLNPQTDPPSHEEEETTVLCRLEYEYVDFIVRVRNSRRRAKRLAPPPPLDPRSSKMSRS